MIRTLVYLYRKIPKRLVSVVFIVAIIAFLVVYLKNTDFNQLLKLHINWWWVVLGLLATLASRYWMVVVWRTILWALGTSKLPSFNLMSYIYAKAWMSRYVPGTVTWIAGKIYMAAGEGIPRGRLAVSSLLEGSMQVVAATIVSLIILGFNPHLDSVPLVARIVVVVVSILCLVILFPPIFNRLLHVAHMLIKKEKPSNELRISGRAVVWSFILFAVGTFITGTGAYLLVLAVDAHLSFGSYLYLVAAFGLSGAIGIAVPFVPSGLGVRDGVLIVLLAAIMPKELAVSLTVFTRLAYVAIDVLFLGCASALHHGPKLQQRMKKAKT